MLQNCRDEVVGLLSAAAQLSVGLAAPGNAVARTAERVALELTAAAAANLTNDLDAKAVRCAGYLATVCEGVAKRRTPNSLLFRGM